MRILGWLGLGTVLLAQGGCGGGGGGGDAPPAGPPPALTGWWLEAWDEVDEPIGYTPFRLLPLDDDGTTVVYEGRALRKEGWTLSAEQPDAAHPDRQVWRFDILDARRIEGLAERFEDGARVWAQRRRLTATTPPDGTLVVNGRVASREVEVDAHRAYAVEYDDGGIWTVLQILDPDAADLTYVWLGYQATPHIPAGTYDVGGANDEIDLQVHALRESDYGVGGNVVLTHSSESRVAGWYIVTLSDGASVTGSFDVAIRASTPWRR